MYIHIYIYTLYYCAIVSNGHLKTIHGVFKHQTMGIKVVHDGWLIIAGGVYYPLYLYLAGNRTELWRIYPL